MAANTYRSRDATPRGRVGKQAILFGLAKRYRDENRNIRIEFLWRRIAVAAALAALCAWLGGSLALWGFVKYRRGIETVDLLDIALPFRWDEFRTKRGEAYIAMGLEAEAAGHFDAAFRLLKAGVANSPRNIEGRIALANAYRDFGNNFFASEILERGLPFAHGNVRYVRALVETLLADSLDAKMISLAETWLPRMPDPKTAQLLALGAAQAKFFRGHYSEAIAMLLEHGLEQSAAGNRILASIDWETDFRELAIHRLESAINRQQADAQTYAILCDFLDTLGQHGAARRVAVEWSLAFPEDATARKRLLFAYRRSGENASLQREIDRLFIEARSSRDALKTLGLYAIESGDVSVALRLRESFGQGEFARFATLVGIETRLTAGDYTNALAEIQELRAAEEAETVGRRRSLISTALETTANYGAGNVKEGDVLLSVFLSYPDHRTADLITFSRQVERAGAPHAARNVLASAVARDPRDQSALTAIIQFDLDHGRDDELVANLSRLMRMRSPPLELLSRCRARVVGDRFLFSPARRNLLDQLDGMIRAHRERAVPLSLPAPASADDAS